MMAYDAKLNDVAMKARALVLWTKRNDTGVCMHGTHNAECRACMVEPPHFPVGVDAFNELESALIDAGLLPKWNFDKPKTQRLPGERYREALDCIRNLLATVREMTAEGVTPFGALSVQMAQELMGDDSGSITDQSYETVTSAKEGT